jgi:hypothetical protein
VNKSSLGCQISSLSVIGFALIEACAVKHMKRLTFKKTFCELRPRQERTGEFQHRMAAWSASASGVPKAFLRGHIRGSGGARVVTPLGFGQAKLRKTWRIIKQREHV